MANNNNNKLPNEAQTNAQEVRRQNAQSAQKAQQNGQGASQNMFNEFGSEFGVSIERQTNAQEVKQQNAQANRKAQQNANNFKK